VAPKLGERSLEGASATEPFVDNDAQGVLVADRSWLVLNLFGRHVGGSADDLLSILVTRTLCDKSDAKIAQADVSAGIALPCCAANSIVHDEEGGGTCGVEVEDAYDVGVN